jgi:hypothetical protein
LFFTLSPFTFCTSNPTTSLSQPQKGRPCILDFNQSALLVSSGPVFRAANVLYRMSSVAERRSMAAAAMQICRSCGAAVAPVQMRWPRNGPTFSIDDPTAGSCRCHHHYHHDITIHYMPYTTHHTLHIIHCVHYTLHTTHHTPYRLHTIHHTPYTAYITATLYASTHRCLRCRKAVYCCGPCRLRDEPKHKLGCALEKNQSRDHIMDNFLLTKLGISTVF